MQDGGAGNGGRVVAGRYRLIGLIDDGAMAQVWHAWDEREGRAVTLKWVRQPLADDPFVAEALIAAQGWAARTSHPNIARSLGIERDGPALLFAREYVPGANLRGWLRQQSGLPALAALVRLLGPAGDALAAAHNDGVIHAHLTMENLLIAEDGRAIVTDFGVRQAMLPLLAIHGVPLGDTATISPEQWRGEPFAPQTDVYALAVVLYEALTYALPFTGNAAPPTVPAAERVMWEHLNLAPPPLRARVPALVPAAEVAILRALAKYPGERPASVPAFLGELAAIARAGAAQQQTAVIADPPTLPAPPPGVPVGAAPTVPLPYPSPGLPPPTPMPTQPLSYAPAPPPKRSRAPLLIPILAIVLLLGAGALLAVFRPWQSFGGTTATATPSVVAASTGTALATIPAATVAATPTAAIPVTPTALPANTVAPTAPAPTATSLPPPTTAPATPPAPTTPAQPTATAAGIIAPLLPTATAIPPTALPPTANPRAVAANMNDPSQWNVQSVELSSRTLANGAYTVRVKKQPDGRGLLSWGDWNPKNTALAPQFVAEVEMQLTGDPKAASGGILFAFNSVPETAQQQFVVFLVRADGQFQLLEQRPGSGAPIVDWTPAAVIKTGANATNTLHVEVRDGRIICAVNGQQVANVPVPAAARTFKGFALAARVLSESAQPDASATFKDLRYAPVG